MADLPTKLVASLWSLPGGNGRYLDTLDKILRWTVSHAARPHRDDFRSWMAIQYNAGKSAISYLHVVLRLGAIERSANGSLVVTPMGERILSADKPVRRT